MNVFRHPSELIGVENPIERAVLEALWAYDPIRHFAAPLEVKAHDGVVEMRGYVRTRAAKLVAEERVRSVPGVRTVKNHLITDTDLDGAVGLALASDERTRRVSPSVTMRALLGTVHLAGRLPSDEIKATVEEVVRGVPGVREVVSLLEAPPALKPAETPAVKPVEQPAPRPVEVLPEEGPPEAVIETAPPEPEVAPPTPAVVPATEPVAAPEPAATEPVRAEAAPAATGKPWEGPRPRTGTGKLAPPLSDERRRMLEEWRAKQ